ncbi:MAG: threonine--tRNA ligase [Candidatus Staskawiczbacteria bacterium]|nr:threonine--tRNA ligase [Candidatus Staskawiczbacteria bacterium]
MSDNIEKIRHSLSHIMAQAVLEFYPKTKLGMGPAIENGFYYDLQLTKPLAETDLQKIEDKMKELVLQNQKFTKEEVSKIKAKKLFTQQPYKLELIKELPGKTVTIYSNGKFVDLCKGPHIKNTSEIKPNTFKLTKIAGAYWKGNEKNKMLTRIYGLAFETEKELTDYLKMLQEAEKRDHRILGAKLKLFTISELIGAGLPLMQPKGMIIRQEIENYLWDLHKNKGYSRVWTPHIAKKDLYETSGHAAKFGNELFRVKGGDEEFFMKPMNCPHHMQIFSDNQFSYRDMPVRYFEPATVYRYEKTGELSGLTRVRAVTQDDGHLFCRDSQISQEVSTIVDIIKTFYTTMNMMDGYWVRLSVRGKDKKMYIGKDESWKKAEDALEKSAKENNLNYKRVEGEAAFYGPKLDFMFKDAIGREWQLATIQCDFNLPERFNLSFINEKGEKERPVVIHRAVSGSLERFMGVMIEHFAGAFPVWLSPIQVAIIPISEKHVEYAKKIELELKNNNVRVEVKNENETLGKKIREAEMQKIPYLLIVGDKEIEANAISVRARSKGDLGQMPTDKFVDKIKEEINSKI